VPDHSVQLIWKAIYLLGVIPLKTNLVKTRSKNIISFQIWFTALKIM